MSKLIFSGNFEIVSSDNKYFYPVTRIIAKSEDRKLEFDIIENVLPNKFNIKLYSHTDSNTDSNTELNDDKNKNLCIMNGYVYKIDKNNTNISFGGLLMSLDYDIGQNNLDTDCVCVFDEQKI